MQDRLSDHLSYPESFINLRSIGDDCQKLNFLDFATTNINLKATQPWLLFLNPQNAEDYPKCFPGLYNTR
jgi:hypothetical protein